MTVELTVEGSGTRRGEMHGEGLRDLVAEAAERWRTSAGNRAEELLTTLVELDRAVKRAPYEESLLPKT